MHVLIVGEHPRPGDNPRGGVQRVVHSLRLALAQRMRVTLVAPQALENAQHTDAAGNKIYIARPRIPSSLLYWNLISRRIGREIARLKPDVVHVQDGAGYALAWPSGTWGSAVVFTVHGILDKDVLARGGGWLQKRTAPARAWMVKQIERNGRMCASAVIAINDYVLEEMPDIHERPHHRIPNPVDRIFVQSEPPARRENGSVEMVQIGIIDQRKNTIEAIELLGTLVKIDQPANLSIIGPIGDRDYFVACQDKIVQLGLTERVRFLGELVSSEIVRQLDRADLLIITSQQETAPMVVAEAQCRGVPVAAQPAFGLRYMIDNGVNGLFLDSESRLDNARKLAAFCADAPDRTRIARDARRLYDIDAITERTIDVYRQACHRQRQSSALVTAGAMGAKQEL